MPNTFRKASKGVTPTANEEALQAPLIDPIDLLSGSITGIGKNLFRSAAKTGISSLVPEIEPMQGAFSKAISGLIEAPEIETTAKNTPDAADNLWNFMHKTIDRVNPLAKEELTQAYNTRFHRLATTFEDLSKMAEGKGDKELSSWMKHYSNLTKQALADTGPRTYAKKVGKTLSKGANFALTSMGYDKEF